MRTGPLSKISLAFSRRNTRSMYRQTGAEAGLEPTSGWKWVLTLCGDANHMAKGMQEARWK